MMMRQLDDNVIGVKFNPEMNVVAEIREKVPVNPPLIGWKDFEYTGRQNVLLQGLSPECVRQVMELWQQWIVKGCIFVPKEEATSD